MSKIEIEGQFETDFDDPGSQKSGEYLADHIFKRASVLIQKDRAGVVQVFRGWVCLREEPRTMLAVRIGAKLGLKEILPEIRALRADIENGRIFAKFYSKTVDAAIASLSMTDSIGE